MTSWLGDPLVRAFEAAAMEGRCFRHREHLYVAWCYLKSLPFEEAAMRYTRQLRALAAALGAPEKYHVTITWAYLVLLADVLADPALGALGFDELVERVPSLFDHRDGVLFELYDREELASEQARTRLVFPQGAKRPSWAGAGRSASGS